MPEISVVMSVFEGVDRLGNTINSVLTQEYEDYEFIIVNDGSSDKNVAGLIQTFVQKDKRVRALTVEHGGLTRALVKGCTHATGKYIARIDAGDVMLKGRLCAQKHILDRYGDCSFVSCWTKFHGPAWEPLWLNKGAPERKEPVHMLNSDLKNGVSFDIPHHGSVMFRASAYKKVGGYRPDFYYGQDWDLWYRLLESGSFMVVGEHLYSARLFPDCISLQNAERQRNIAECARRAFGARSQGKSERPWLQNASAIRPSGNGTGSKRRSQSSLEPGQYFIGEALRRNGDPRCRQYLLQAIRSKPWRIRSYVRLVQSYAEQ